MLSTTWAVIGPSWPPPVYPCPCYPRCGTSLWLFQVSCPGQVPHSSLGSSSLPEHGELTSPWLKGSTAQQQLQHPCAVSVILILNPTTALHQLLAWKLTLSQTKAGEQFPILQQTHLHIKISKLSSSLLILQNIWWAPAKLFNIPSLASTVTTDF